MPDNAIDVLAQIAICVPLILCEQQRFWRVWTSPQIFALAFVTVPKSHVLAQIPFMRVAETMMSLHICAGSHVVTGQCDKYRDTKMAQHIPVPFVRAAKALASLQRLAGAFVTVPKFHELALLCAIYMTSVGSGESAAATTANVCNHRCIVSIMLQ